VFNMRKHFLLLFSICLLTSTANALTIDGREFQKDTYFDKGINLVENPDAKIVSYDELIKFLKDDTTDENYFIGGFYTCGNFMEDLHNNAEEAGIKAGCCIIETKDHSYFHGLNMFETTDRGTVFIEDCVDDGGDCVAEVGTHYYNFTEIDTNRTSSRYLNGTVSFFYYW